MTKKNKISYAQKPLPFAGQSRVLAEPLKREWRAVSIATALVLVLSVLYGYAVVSSIAHVSYRETARKEVRALTTERGSLEQAYLVKTSGITETYARTLGYRDPQERIFVARPETLSYASDAR